MTYIGLTTISFPGWVSRLLAQTSQIWTQILYKKKLSATVKAIFFSKYNNQSSNMTLVLSATMIKLTVLIQSIFVEIILSRKIYSDILAPEVFCRNPLIIIVKWQLNVTESSLLSSMTLQFHSFTIFQEKNEIVTLAIICFFGYFKTKQRFEVKIVMIEWKV